MGISIVPILSVLTQIYQWILLASYEASGSQATQQSLASPCPAWPWGQWGHPGQARMSPQPHHPRLCHKPCGEIWGAPCSGRCWQECGNQHARSRWKPSKLPTPLYKSHTKILIPKKFNPGSVTRLPPRQLMERGLHSQPCTHPGKTPSGERAPQEGRGPRCFHTNDPLKKDRRARQGGRIARRCKTSGFSMSHQWKDQIRRPTGGLGPGRLRIPAAAGRMLRAQPRPCAALSSALG